MTDLKRRLDLAGQHYGSDPDAFERLERRRARKHRNERLTGATAGLAAAVVAVVILIRAFGGSGTVPSSAPGANGELMYSKNVESGWSLFAVDPVSGTERQVTHGYRDYDNAWSPDGTRIIYQSEDRETNNQTLFIANPDGSGARNLGIEGGSPSWSPDGSHIVYQGPVGAIWTSLTDGSQAERLTTPTGTGTERTIDFHPVWSPTGLKLGFVRANTETGRDELRVLTDSGEELLVATGDPEGYIGALDWSPDGQRITFASVVKAPEGAAAATNSHIFVVPAMGGEPTQLTQNMDGRGWNTYPTWSPDGTKIAYVDDSRGKIVIMNPDGTDKQDLAVRSGNDSIVFLNWGTQATLPDATTVEPSPDAASTTPTGRLVFERAVRGERHIYSMTPDGMDVAELTSGSNDQSGSLSPDGLTLAFTDEGRIFLANSDGRGPRALTDAADGYASDPDWNADGSSLVFTQYYGDNLSRVAWVDVESGHVRPIATGAGSDYAPAASVDGRVAFTRCSNSGCGIWATDTSGESPALLTSAPGVDFPEWSPDGAELLLIAQVPDGNSLALLDPDGNVQALIAGYRDPRSGADSAAWSPGGSQIAFTAGNSIWIVDVDGSDLTKVRTFDDEVGAVSWGVSRS